MPKTIAKFYREGKKILFHRVGLSALRAVDRLLGLEEPLEAALAPVQLREGRAQRPLQAPVPLQQGAGALHGAETSRLRVASLRLEPESLRIHSFIRRYESLRRRSQTVWQGCFALFSKSKCFKLNVSKIPCLF